MPPYEVSHKKPRLTPVRPSDNKDHADGANAVDRSRDFTQDGRFKKGNQAAKGTGPKRKTRNLVPVAGRKLFDDLCRQIGADGGTLSYLHAMMAVSLYLDAAALAELGRNAGLDTPHGKDLEERATRKAEAGLREATAALDAARLFKRPGVAKRKTSGPPPGFEEAT